MGVPAGGARLDVEDVKMRIVSLAILAGPLHREGEVAAVGRESSLTDEVEVEEIPRGDRTLASDSTPGALW
jgi:hypothetical protein